MSNWWKRLNEKPPGWDEPKNRRARVIMAIFLGVSLYFSRHWLGIH